MYTYKIIDISNNDKWIYVKCNEANSTQENEPFVELVKNIATKWNHGEWQGNISSVGDMRYRIKNDPHSLIYQWDGLFGIVLGYPSSANLDHIKTFLFVNYGIA